MYPTLSGISNSLKKMTETKMLHRNIKLSTISPSPSQQHFPDLLKYHILCSLQGTRSLAKTGFATGHSTARISSWKGAAGVLLLPPKLGEEGLSRQRGISSWTSCAFRECSTCAMTLHIREESPRLAAVQLNAQHLAPYKALCVQLCSPKRWSDIRVGIWGENS